MSRCILAYHASKAWHDFSRSSRRRLRSYIPCQREETMLCVPFCRLVFQIQIPGGLRGDNGTRLRVEGSA